MNAKHLSEEELIWTYYGEGLAEETRAHLAVCEECSARLEEVKSSLCEVQAPAAAEPPYGFELKMWRAVEQRIGEGEKRSIGWLAGWRPWAFGALAAALLVGAFFIGRFTSRPVGDSAQNQVAKSDQKKEVLQVALAEHFDDSQRLLVELTHVESTGAIPDASKRAEELLASNRLYRQTAQQNGDKNVAQVLDQLERVLMQVAHEGESPSVDDQQAVGEQVIHTGLLFKVRVLANPARQAPKQDWANTGSKGQQI